MRDAYAAERDQYKRLGALIADELRSELRTRRIECIVETRAKEVSSFVKKALRKGYANPLAEIGDKAGVRVIVHFLSETAHVEEIATEKLEVLARESKLDALAFNEFGYLGVHLAVRLREGSPLARNAPDLAGLTAELQIHTKAQSAWAVVSHDLLYKSPVEVPSDLKRTITRLVALVELFDGEVARFQKELHEHPDFQEMQVIEPLDDLLVEFTDRPPDRGLSLIVVPPLVRASGVQADEVFARVVHPFVERHREQLERIYANYRNDDRATPLLFQPEALLIFASLARDRYRVVEAWPSDKLPIELLYDLAAIWGIDLDEEAA